MSRRQRQRQRWSCFSMASSVRQRAGRGGGRPRPRRAASSSEASWYSVYLLYWYKSTNTDANAGATVQLLTQTLCAGVAGASAHAGAAGKARVPHQVLAYSMSTLVAQVLVCQNSWPSPGTSIYVALMCPHTTVYLVCSHFCVCVSANMACSCRASPNALDILVPVLLYQ